MSLLNEVLRESILKAYRTIKTHDSEMAALLAPLYGKSLAIYLTEPFNFAIAFELSENELKFINPKNASVRLSGSLRGFITQSPRFAWVLPDPLNIEGCTESASLWQNFFNKAQLDIPALLDPIIGEVASGMLADSANSTKHHLKHSFVAFKENFKTWINTKSWDKEG